MHRKEWMFAGRKLVLETGRMAKQAHGACLVQYGETVALCTVTAQDRPTHLPFFPLTVEYRTRSYAAGKIPGGFFKREGRPAEQEILAARLIDRPIRPLFPDGFMDEIQIQAWVMSHDTENDTDVLAGTAAVFTDPDEDRRAGEALLASHKDRWEHELAVRSVATALDSLDAVTQVPSSPSLLRLDNVRHLATHITGTVTAKATGTRKVSVN